ncbi:MAG: DMT family transporter [Dysgonamonadaceae bacterium]|jgi:drug/metabolite transporter (DMT)-like permease|nr:DMT family transporter [Dysgonamonadaceae bacterium]
MILFLALFFRILSSPLANVFQKKLTASGQHPLWVNFVGFFLLSVACLPFAGNVAWSSFGRDFWLYCVLGGIVGALGNGYLIKAVQSGDLSVVGPINSYKSVVGLLFGIPILGELPHIEGIIGIGLIIYGSFFILDTMGERFSWKIFNRPEIRFRFAAMILTAIEAIFIKKIIILSSPERSFMVWCFFNALFSFGILFVFGVNPKSEITAFKKSHIRQYLLLILSIGVMQFGTNYSFANMPVAYALALFQLSSLVSVLFGYRFFHETQIRKKIIGASIMIAGAVLIILM